MRRRTLTGIFILLLHQQSFAQHADLGTGALKNQIWWFNWAGLSITEGATRTVTTDDGLTIRIVFSNVTAREPVPTVMNNYFGAMLHLLYDFSDPSILPSLYDGTFTGSVGFTMTASASRNGTPVSFYLVTADAEASWDGETTTLHTNGGSWQTMTLFRNSTQTSDPLTGCGTQNVSIHDTFDGNAQEGQSPIITTLSPSANPLVLDVTMDHAATTGGMALAFGVLQSVDRGDLPASYGAAQHQLLYSISNPCNYLAPLPELRQDQTLMIGSVPGDADPIQYTDDNAIGIDEEGVGSFPQYDGSGAYSVNVTVGNTTGSDAWLTGWFDYNRDGSFGPGESVTVPIPNNAGSTVLTWSGLPAFLPRGTAAGYGFRFRLSSDRTAAQNATGYAKDGEVEDYFVTSDALCLPLLPRITPDTAICMGQPAPLHASGGSSYAWSPAANLSDPSVADPITTLLSMTTYTVTVANPQGCSASASVTVTIKPPPIIMVSNDTTVCQGIPVTLNATGGIGYTWTSSDNLTNTSAQAISVSPVNSTRYSVLVTGSNSCTDTGSVDVTVHHLPIFTAVPGHPVICKDDSVLLTASGGDRYAWTSDAGLPLGTSSSIRVSPPDNSLYQVQITDDICRLTSTLGIPVLIKALPDLSITKSNDIDCTLGQATLQATGAVSWQWDSLPGISGLTSSGPVVRPGQTTTYFVKGTGDNGCSSIDSITVSADFTSDLSHYPVPSAFSPNNDGNNDCFGLKYWGSVNSLELSVFNRWGQRVFFTSNPQQCWDGTYKGTPQPAGGYVYQIRASTPCGLAYRKGIVILVR